MRILSLSSALPKLFTFLNEMVLKELVLKELLLQELLLSSTQDSDIFPFFVTVWKVEDSV